MNSTTTSTLTKINIPVIKEKVFLSSKVHNFQTPPLILKGDSGATNHYLSPAAISVLKNVQRNTNITVSLPDNSVIHSTHTGNLPLHHLSDVATQAHILPDLLNNSLLSLGQLADDGCLILLSKQFLHVFKNFHLILKGFRNNFDGLWDVPLDGITVAA